MLSAMRSNAGRDEGDDDMMVVRGSPPPMRSVSSSKKPRAPVNGGGPPASWNEDRSWFANPEGSVRPRGSVIASIGFARRVSSIVAGKGSSKTPPAPKRVHPIFNNCDANRDGKLSRSEFTNAVQMILYSQKEAG